MEIMGQSKKKLSWQAGAVLLLVCAFFCVPAVGGPQIQQRRHRSAARQTAARPASGPQGGQGMETIHIIVGHSLVINTPTRVRRILTGNPEVIESVVTSPAELVVTAKKPGSSSLVLWNENGRTRALDVYGDLDVTSLRSSVEQAFPNVKLDVQSEGSKVVLTGSAPTKEVAEQVAKMASSFSGEVVNGLQVAPPPHERQVMLKVRFAEADRNKLNQFGVNLFSTGATNTIGTISTQQFGPVALGQAGGGSPSSCQSLGPSEYFLVSSRYQFGCDHQGAAGKTGPPDFGRA